MLSGSSGAIAVRPPTLRERVAPPTENARSSVEKSLKVIFIKNDVLRLSSLSCRFWVVRSEYFGRVSRLLVSRLLLLGAVQNDCVGTWARSEDRPYSRGVWAK